MSISADTLRGHTDTIILAQLMRGDNYGYEINKNIQQMTQGEYGFKEATLYTCLL
ncbi:MAG: PadR family transcriptional regulator [Oscillospiraceae bacterium]|nr:PadR family transcriptional regulator [Oscillospiraceae bacterium]